MKRHERKPRPDVGSIWFGGAVGQIGGVRRRVRSFVHVPWKGGGKVECVVWVQMDGNRRGECGRDPILDFITKNEEMDPGYTTHHGGPR